jgi:hypothetical protein
VIEDQIPNVKKSKNKEGLTPQNNNNKATNNKGEDNCKEEVKTKVEQI